MGPYRPQIPSLERILERYDSSKGGGRRERPMGKKEEGVRKWEERDREGVGRGSPAIVCITDSISHVSYILRVTFCLLLPKLW